MWTAARIAKNKQAETDMAEIRFRAERALGEMMAAQRDAGHMAPAGRPKEIGFEENPIIKPPTLAEAGIDKNLADRARKFAANFPQESRRVSEAFACPIAGLTNL